MAIDFEALNRKLLADAFNFLSTLLPGGQRRGREYVCASLQGGKGRSCSVNMETGCWSDFAEGIPGGDLISLYAAVKGLDQGQAAKDLETQLGLSNGHGSANGKGSVSSFIQQLPTVPAPKSAGVPSFYHPTYKSEPVETWEYRSKEGYLMGWICRYVDQHDKKQYCPFTWDGRKWNRRGWSDPQPIYGADDLELRKDMPVMIVEGEKTCDGARKLTTRFVCITWPGGAQRWHKVDWSVLKGRRVMLWPDNDEVGIKAMEALAQELMKHGCDVAILRPPEGKPKGWDAADAVAEGWTVEDLQSWASGSMYTIASELPAIQNPGKPATITPIHQQVSEIKPSGLQQQASARAIDTIQAETRWLEWGLLTTGKHGTPVSNVANVRTVLTLDPGLQGIVWYDEFLQRIMTASGAHGGTREWTDADEVHLQIYLQQGIQLKTIGDNHVHRAILEYARANPKHCVKDWLTSLKWDGVSRIDNFFEDFFGCPRDAYHMAAARSFWLSMGARVFRPGCKVDTMIILQGDQGLRKSMALEVIGGAWWTAQHEAVTSKDFFQVIQGKLLVEIGEWDSFRGAEIDKVKDVISCPNDRYRVPYEQYPADHPRQCIFAANTNKDDWNRDETGARRFLPIWCRFIIDIDGIYRWREQLFAEAVHRLSPFTPWSPSLMHFEGGEDWWTMPDQAKDIQDEHYVGSVWQDIIEEWLPGKSQVTMREVLVDCLKVDIAKISRKDELAAGAALTALGWRKHVVRDSNNRKCKAWRPKES